MEHREKNEKKQYAEPMVVEFGDVNVLTLGS
jgi:hypothetical protein